LPGLIVLNLRQDGRRRSVVVFADSAPGEAQRQLRVFLRWFAAPAADSTFIVQADKS
jgi:toxin CptA